MASHKLNVKRVILCSLEMFNVQFTQSVVGEVIFITLFLTCEWNAHILI